MNNHATIEEVKNKRFLTPSSKSLNVSAHEMQTNSQDHTRDNYKISHLTEVTGFKNMSENIQSSCTGLVSFTKKDLLNIACEEDNLKTNKATLMDLTETDDSPLTEYRNMTLNDKLNHQNQADKVKDSSMKELINKTVVPKPNPMFSDNKEEISAIEDFKNIAKTLKSSKDEMYAKLKPSSSILSNVVDDHKNDDIDSDLENLEEIFKTMKGLAKEIKEKYKVTALCIFRSISTLKV